MLVSENIAFFALGYHRQRLVISPVESLKGNVSRQLGAKNLSPFPPVDSVVRKLAGPRHPNTHDDTSVFPFGCHDVRKHETHIPLWLNETVPHIPDCYALI